MGGCKKKNKNTMVHSKYMFTFACKPVIASFVAVSLTQANVTSGGILIGKAQIFRILVAGTQTQVFADVACSASTVAGGSEAIRAATCILKRRFGRTLGWVRFCKLTKTWINGCNDNIKRGVISESTLALRRTSKRNIFVARTVQAQICRNLI